MKSNYNMVMSIIGGFISIVFLILSIIFSAINSNVLGIIFSSIFYLFIIAYFIINSIYYGCGSNALYRFSNILVSIFTSLILIYFTLNYDSFSKWILFGFICLFLILEILLDSFDNLIEIKYLFEGIKLSLIIYLFVCFYCNFVLLLGISSVVLFFFSRLLGKVLKNKIILSYDIISLIIFGIFFLFN